MSEADLDDGLYMLEEPNPAWVSVAALQCRLRELFATKPPHRALAIALQQMGELLTADYAVIHARYGATPLSEEWCREDYELGDGLREAVNSTMAAADTSEEARCVRLESDEGAGAVVAAVLYDEGFEQAGSAAFVFRDCGRGRAYEVLVQIESLVGFLALLLSSRGRPTAGNSAATAGPSGAEIGEPVRLLLQLAAELGNRHGFDQVAIGIVHGARVRVALMNGEAEPRAANPGVRLVQNAMGECLDRGAAVIAAGDPAVAESRLHASWLAARGGGAVASVPLSVGAKAVAIVSVASADPTALTPEKLAAMERDVAAYPPLLRVARLATRSLVSHAGDVMAARWRSWLDGRWRRFVLLPLALAIVTWTLCGSLPFSLTVPGVVKATDRRTISCPREGILTEFFVRPGDSVRNGQLLAELDSHDNQLLKVDLECQQRALEAQIDKALADHDAGLLRVLEAQHAGVVAKMRVVELRIEQAKIRAPQDGIVLTGDLREAVGGRLAMGDKLFEIARGEGAIVELRIPERLLLDARETVAASYVASADPGRSYPLADLRIAPASTVADGHNAFLAEGRAAASLSRLSPGMEGFVMLEVGRRPVWWVLSHRVVAWLRLNFWI